ncbi:hypothetical protein NHX12_008966 [Muraenolepis orangiensis]|uniref:Pentraxin (PTX) domain-containing protein n=1 Tax=Muraenolepis orangiensis TaxID=630683 RepID=A0A9Q0DKM9_9TELE|nr:hypothetical protein NHX12_008966 [Muraenolepis orangiensis]
MMLLWSLSVCLVSLTQGTPTVVLGPAGASQGADPDWLEDEFEVNYNDHFYNDILEVPSDAMPSPPPPPCKSGELTKWDKLFSMLENSQMRENMLLQYADDIIKVEMGSLRSELLRWVWRTHRWWRKNGGACGVAVETAGRRLSQQLEKRLRDTMERLGLPASVGASVPDEALLQQVLSAMRNRGPAGHPEQEVVSSASGDLESALAAVLLELQQTRAELQQVTSSSRQRYLPAGCELALLFPMRSRRIYVAVVPDVPLSLSSFTACLWAKPTAGANRTVLLSYGTRHNPYEIQLLFSGSSALFTVAGEAHLVEGRGVVDGSAPAPQWIHLCGAWSSRRGRASLWADGRKVASAPGVAEGRVLPADGFLQLGQEGLEDGFDPRLAFAGQMTGVDVWDRVLSDEEIASAASREARGCGPRGNVVAWGVTEMEPRGGAQFIH